MHVLDTDRAAVRVAQDLVDVAEGHLRLAAETAGRVDTVEVPQAQAVEADVEVWVRTHLELERVDVGNQVATNAVGVDELLDAGFLRAVVDLIAVEVGCPADRLVRNAKRFEDLVVETALAEKQLVDLLEELARAGTLNDAVVVGAGKVQNLADAELVEVLLAHALELGRVVECAGADDATLPLHQARNRVDGADAAWVGERHGAAGEVASGQLVGASALD